MNTCLYANENDAYGCAVYRKHWPDGTLHQEDIRNVTAEDVCRRGKPDVIAGGWPCQDLSVAGKRVGLEGKRSGLWFEMLRLVRAVRPQYVVVENVPGLLVRGMGRVLADLAESGYDAQWQTLPAAAFGAPHRRDRVFIVAYATELFRDGGNRQPQSAVSKPRNRGSSADVAYAEDPNGRGAGGTQDTGRRDTEAGGCGECGRGIPDWGAKCGVRRVLDGLSERLDSTAWSDGEWEGVPRVITGQPDRVNRLKCLGNAIVPQVAQFVGETVMRHNGGEFTFAELFCGIGGFRRGFERARTGQTPRGRHS